MSALLSSPAAADTFTLSLSAPKTATVGTPFAVTGSGVDPTDQGALYLEIDAIPTSFTTTCPDGYLDGGQLASSTGGDLVSFDQRENFDSAGNFSNVSAETRNTPGGILLCGYTDDGATDTLATASTTVNVQSAGAKAAKPSDKAKPRITRSGKNLSCSRGAWSGSPQSFSFIQWMNGGKAIKKATRSKLSVTKQLKGHAMSCRVTAKNSAGSASATSRQFKVK